MDTNDNMKRLGEHPAMKEIPETFDDDSMKAAAAYPAPHKKSRWGLAALALLGVAVLAAAVFLVSNNYYGHNARNDEARMAAMSNPGNVNSGELIEIDAIAYAPGTQARQQPGAATVTDASARAQQALAQASAQSAATDTPDAVYLFPNDGSTVSNNADLDAVAKEAVAENADVLVTAYTDETGSTAYNQRLSEQRAKAVSDYLVAHGVAPEHIRTIGYGPTHAFATNALDRRAEVRIVS